MLESITVLDGVVEEVQRKHSTDLERETAYIDIFTNCHPSSSWEEIAKKLYKRQQVAAVEEVRSYLPPRGEPAFWSACISHC